jgi:hypothetical protein
VAPAQRHRHGRAIADGGKRSAFLLRVKAGRGAAPHASRPELTLVLTGAPCDAANCFERRSEQPIHDRPSADRAGQRGRICIVALEAPIC